MSFPSERFDFLVCGEARPAFFEITPNAAHRFGLIGAQLVLSVIAGDIREQRASRSVLLFFGQVA